MVRIPTHRQPTHPGEMLLEEFLKPLGLTQRELAEAIGVPYQRVNEITPEGGGNSIGRRVSRLLMGNRDWFVGSDGWQVT